MTPALKELRKKLKDKRYWKKDSYSTDFILTEEGQEVWFKIEKEKMRLRELKEKDPVYLAKKIDKHTKDLFKGLTQRDIPDSKSTSRTQVTDDYIRPSREFRTGLFYEFPEDMRISLYNAMVYTRAALDDTLKQIDNMNHD